MKKNEKRLILILLIILIIAIIIFAKGKNKKEVESQNNNIQTTEQYVEILEDGTKLNTSTKLNEIKTLNGIEFGNIQFTNKDGKSVLLAEVKNTTEKETEVMLIDIILLDKQGKEIATVGGIISGLKAGESKQFNSTMTADYTNAYDFKIVIK